MVVRHIRSTMLVILVSLCGGIANVFSVENVDSNGLLKLTPADIQELVHQAISTKNNELVTRLDFKHYLLVESCLVKTKSKDYYSSIALSGKKTIFKITALGEIYSVFVFFEGELDGGGVMCLVDNKLRVKQIIPKE